MSGPLRSVALISNTAFAIANFRGPLIEALVARGVRVHALAPDFDSKTRSAITRLGAEPVEISMERNGLGLIRDAGDFVRLYRTLRALRPDATFSFFIKPVIYGSLAGKLAGISSRYALVAGLGYVFTAGNAPQTFKRLVLQRVVSLLYRMAFSVCQRVFFQNADDIAYCVGKRLLERDRAVLTNGTGVDLQQLRPAPLVTNPITFLLMARLLKEKGVLEYAEAARRVKASYPAARFMLLGDFDSNPGSLSPADIAPWVRDGTLEWPGHVDDVRPWIAESSVYVLPSYYREGVPRSTQEAMAMGRPVITTDWIGCRETVVDGVSGFLVPARDAGALAAAMLRFVNDPSLLMSMGEASRRLAEERFDAHKINAEILRVMGVRPMPLVVSKDLACSPK